ERTASGRHQAEARRRERRPRGGGGPRCRGTVITHRERHHPGERVRARDREVARRDADPGWQAESQGRDADGATERVEGIEQPAPLADAGRRERVAENGERRAEAERRRKEGERHGGDPHREAGHGARNLATPWRIMLAAPTAMSMRLASATSAGPSGRSMRWAQQNLPKAAAPPIVPATREKESIRRVTARAARGGTRREPKV